MNFYMPVNVIVDESTVKKNAKVFKQGKSALIVTGHHSSKINGSLDDVKDVLKENKIKYFVYDQIEENPKSSTILKARDIGVETKTDFVIGLGGGSAMDAAKSISILIKNKSKGIDYLFVKEPFESLPLICIPTTAGTGSEVTPYSILTIVEDRTKKSIAKELFADYAILDYRYLKTAKLNVLRDTAVDQMCHLIESYVNTRANFITKMICLEGLSLFAKSKDALVSGNLADIDFKNLMLSSSIAGVAIAHTTTSIPHGLSYSLTYEAGIAHGKACGYFIANYLRFAPSEEVRKVLDTLSFDTIDSLDKFYKTVCGDFEADPDILKLAVNNLYNVKAKLEGAPFEVSKDVLYKIAGIDK